MKRQVNFDSLGGGGSITLEALIPRLTSSTSASGSVGTAISSQGIDSGNAYRAFDEVYTDFFISVANQPLSDFYCGFQFNSAQVVKGAYIEGFCGGAQAGTYYFDVAVYGGNSLSSLVKLSTNGRIDGDYNGGTYRDNASKVLLEFNNAKAYSIYVIKIEDSNMASAHVPDVGGLEIPQIQFFGE